jgi:N-acetylmuramoyl-L-alanine amidase
MHRPLTCCWLTSSLWRPSTHPLSIVAYILPTVLSVGLLITLQQSARGQQPNAGTNRPAAIDSPPPSISRPLLRLGSEGDAVKELQALLTLLGFYSGSVDGRYQTNTVTAVTEFQTSAGLQPDGVVGPATWNRLLPAAQTATSVAPIASAVATTAPSEPPAASGASSTRLPASMSPAAIQDRTTGPRPSPSAAPDASALVDFPVLRLGMRGPAVTRLQQRLQALDFLDGAIDGVFGPATQAAVKAAQRHFRLNPDGVVGTATWTALMR